MVKHNSKVDIMGFSIPKVIVSDQQMHNNSICLCLNRNVLTL